MTWSMMSINYAQVSPSDHITVVQAMLLFLFSTLVLAADATWYN